MRKIKGCWFRKKKNKKAAVAIAAIQTALQRSHHYHLAQCFPGCFANTRDKQTCGLCFRVADLGLSNSQRNQSFDLEWLSQEKKYQFPVLASHPTVTGCLLPAGKGEVYAQKRKPKKITRIISIFLLLVSAINTDIHVTSPHSLIATQALSQRETGIAMLDQITQSRKIPPCLSRSRSQHGVSRISSLYVLNGMDFTKANNWLEI